MIAIWSDANKLLHIETIVFVYEYEYVWDKGRSWGERKVEYGRTFERTGIVVVY